MRLGRKQEVFSRAFGLLLQFASFKGYEIRIGDVSRSMQEAKRLGFANSLHTKRIAADLNLFKDGKYLRRTESHRELGEFWESLSGDYDGHELKFCWGGRFRKPDGNHYSIKHGENM